MNIQECRAHLKQEGFKNLAEARLSDLDWVKMLVKCHDVMTASKVHVMDIDMTEEIAKSTMIYPSKVAPSGGL